MDVHGNGNLRTRAIKPPEAAAELMEPPAWLRSMREAISGAMQAADLAQIMAAQVAKAKAGDERAAKFVLDQAHKLMDAENRRHVSFTQNNYYDTERPDTPATVPPGDERKIRKMRMRADAGLPLTDPADGPRVMSDEEEKEFRRRQDAQEEAA